MADWLDGYFENKPIVDSTVNPADGGATVEDGTITNAKLAAAAANTIKSNPTTGSLAPTDMTVAINTLVGRGPTGNIDDLAVQAGLTITDTTIGRPAFTGDVTASANGNVLTIANDTVTTAKILDANVTTAKIALNAVGNQRMAQMATKTVKGNATGSTANSQDMTIAGGLYTDGTSVLKAKSGVGWHYTYNTGTSGDPATGGVAFNDVDLADITTMRIHQTTLGGRDIDAYIGTWSSRGRITLKSNDAAGTAFLILDVSGTSGDSGTYWSVTVTPLAGVGVMPANGEEVVLHFESIGSSADVTSAALAANVVRFDELYQLIDSNGVVRSGTASVATYADLLALDAATYAGFAVVVNSLSNKPVFKSDGTNWLPLNGGYMHDRSNVTVKKVICANQVTWSISNSGGFVRLTGTAHGLTAAANGYQLYATNTTTNIPAGTFLTVTYVDANTLDTDLAFTSTSGNPTFAIANSTKIPVLALTVPPLRANSRYLIEAGLRGQTDATATGNRVYVALGATDITQLTYTAASNETFPFRSGFFNQNNVSVQRGRYGKSSSGSGSGSDYVSHTLDTSTGTQVITFYLYCFVVNFGLELSNYDIKIEG